MQVPDLASEFISEHGNDAYEAVKHHAGTHATQTDVVTVDDLPTDERRLFLYGLMEIAEHECGKEESECDVPISDDDVFHFLLGHYPDVSRELEELPSRGAGEYRQDLKLLYPFHDSVDLHVEIDSETSGGQLNTLAVLGRDRPAGGDGNDLPLVWLVPCSSTVNDPEEIPKRYPVERGIPQFETEAEGSVEVVVPVPESVWQITTDISPGFMTLDGWDYRNNKSVNVLVGVVSSANPSKSRSLLNKLLGDDDEWAPPE